MKHRFLPHVVRLRRFYYIFRVHFLDPDVGKLITASRGEIISLSRIKTVLHPHFMDGGITDAENNDVVYEASN